MLFLGFIRLFFQLALELGHIKGAQVSCLLCLRACSGRRLHTAIFINLHGLLASFAFLVQCSSILFLCGALANETKLFESAIHVTDKAFLCKLVVAHMTDAVRMHSYCSLKHASHFDTFNFAFGHNIVDKNVILHANCQVFCTELHNRVECARWEIKILHAVFFA